MEFLKKNAKAIIGIGAVIGLSIAGYFILKDKSVAKGDESSDSEEPTNKEDNTGIAIGDMIKPSGSYVNIRSSAEVNDGYINNKIGEVNSTTIGKVIGKEENKDTKLTWYIDCKIPFIEDYTEGYVRFDNVKKV